MKTRQPNSKMCFICGLENPVGLHLHIYEVEPGMVETSYRAPEHFQGYPGVLHGGIVAALLDEIAGRSHMGHDPTDELLAEGNARLINVPEEQFDRSRLDELGWKVYPE